MLFHLTLLMCVVIKNYVNIASAAYGRRASCPSAMLCRKSAIYFVVLCNCGKNKQKTTTIRVRLSDIIFVSCDRVCTTESLHIPYIVVLLMRTRTPRNEQTTEAYRHNPVAVKFNAINKPLLKKKKIFYLFEQFAAQNCNRVCVVVALPFDVVFSRQKQRSFDNFHTRPTARYTQFHRPRFVRIAQ